VAPPPLPTLDELAAGSAWISRISGLTEEIARLDRLVAEGKEQAAAAADEISRPRLTRATAQALIRTLLRFWWLLLVGVGDLLGPGRRRSGRPSAAVRRAQRLVQAGGPAYVKVGQSVATAQGILPEEWVDAFAWCRDEVPPMPAEVAEAAVADALGRPVTELFAWFDRQPCGAASIAQAHYARLHDGTEVVVKVQRPGLRARFEADLRVMAVICTVIDRLSRKARVANAPGVLNTFTHIILGELDFRAEAVNMVHIGLANERAGLGYVRVPRPIPGMITPDVLVMERVEGIPYNRARDAYGDAINGEELLRLATLGVLEHALVYGVFHGDLHAGNVLLAEDGTISLVDFGVTGRVTAFERAMLVRLLIAVVQRDYRAQVMTACELGSLPPGFDLDEVVAEVEKYSTFFMEFADTSLSALDFSSVAGQMAGAIRTLARYRFEAPKELVLFSRNLLYLNGFAQSLAPHINLMAELEPMLRHFTAKYPAEITRILFGAFTRPAASA
jgi:ubiquinone biosynthesis protein